MHKAYFLDEGGCHAGIGANFISTNSGIIRKDGKTLPPPSQLWRSLVFDRSPLVLGVLGSWFFLVLLVLGAVVLVGVGVYVWQWLTLCGLVSGLLDCFLLWW